MSIKIFYSDEQLVKLAQNGHANACNMLLGRYYPEIQRIIHYYTQDPNSVNDIAQEVLIKVHRYLNQFNKKSSFFTWLYKIIQNTIKNYYRELKQSIGLDPNLLEKEVSLVYQSPESQLINTEFMEQIETAIYKLSKELRLCYGLLLFEGCSYEEIAQKMQCPIGTVRSRIFRARKILTSHLECNFTRIN